MFDRAKSKYLKAFEDLHKLGDITMSTSERGEKHEVVVMVVVVVVVEVVIVVVAIVVAVVVLLEVVSVHS